MRSKRLARLGTVGALLWAGLVQARELVVYMKEDAQGKQIWAMDDAGARPLTSGAAWHLYPAVSADGSQVAYVEGPDDKDLGVMVRRFDSDRVEQWTAVHGGHLQTAFSGDGRLLSFSGPLGPNGEARIGIIDVQEARRAADPEITGQGAEKRFVYRPKARVIDSSDPAYFPCLSSDGGFLVFHRSKADGTKEVVEVDLKSGALRQLTGTGDTCMAPALSFDDRFVAFTSRKEGNWDVYLLERATGNVRRVTTDPEEDFAPTFAPGGDLLFASKRGGHFGLYRVNVRSFDQSAFEPRAIAVEPGADLYAPSVSGNLDFDQRRLPSLPEPARSSFGAVEHRGQIYVAGGHRGPEHTYPAQSFVAALDAFNLVTGVWRPLSPRPTPSQGFDLVAWGDFLYAFGGFAYSAENEPHWRSLDVIERYSLRENRWEAIATMPRRRSSHVAVPVGSKVYLIGGWDSTPAHKGDEEGRFHREIDVFDLETETVAPSEHALPDPLRRAFTAVVRGGKIVLLGGLGPGSTHFELLDQVTEFDPATGAWRELPRLPFATFAPAAGEQAGELFSFGGLLRTGPGPKDFTYVNHVYSLAPGDTRWIHTGRYLGEPKGFARVLPLGPRGLALLGGHSRVGVQDAPVATFEVFERR